MSDPLSVAASVIACAVLGLKSVKIIHTTISEIKNAPKEFAGAQLSLQALDGVLDQIRELANQARHSSSQGIQLQTLSIDQMVFLKSLSEHLQLCTAELDPLVEKVTKWAEKYSAKSWGKMAVGAAHHYIKSGVIKDIEVMVAKHHTILSNHLAIAGYKQNKTLIAGQASMKEDLSTHSSQITAKLEFSATETQDKFSSRFNSLDETLRIRDERTIQEFMAIAIKQTSEMKSHFEQQMAAFKESENRLMGSSANHIGGRSSAEVDALQNRISQLEEQLTLASEAKTPEDLDQRLQNCISQLYDIRQTVKFQSDIHSQDIQQILEELFEILKEIVQSSITPRDFNTASYSSRENASVIADQAHELEVKRIAKMLGSAQDIQMQDSVWQKNVNSHMSTRKHQIQVLDTPSGILYLEKSVFLFAGGSQNVESGQEIKEVITRSITLLPKPDRRRKREKRMKIQAFFVQKIMKNASTMNFSPMISFHAIIPEDSEVFELIIDGDLRGLKRLLEDGQASLTDCDTYGRSLLWYGIQSLSGGKWISNEENELLSFPHEVCAFLIEHGADVNRFEPANIVFKDSFFEPVFMYLQLYADDETLGIESSQRVRSLQECERLFLNAGMDATLCDPYGDSVLSGIVHIGRLESLKNLLANQDSLFDMNQLKEDGEGYTVLLDCIRRLNYASGFEKQFPEIQIKKANVLLDYGASASPKNHSNENCLHLALAEPPFDREDGFDGDTSLWKPHSILTPLLVRLITAGADVLARDIWSSTPSDKARESGYERSWREALTKCGHSPEKVYLDSGLEWTELEEIIPENEVAATLSRTQVFREIEGSSRQYLFRFYLPETLQGLLTEGIRNSTDITQDLPNYGGCNLSEIARDHRMEREWRQALETCRFDSKDIYARSGVAWVENENLSYPFDEVTTSESEGAEDEEEQKDFATDPEYSSEEETKKITNGVENFVEVTFDRSEHTNTTVREYVDNNYDKENIYDASDDEDQKPLEHRTHTRILLEHPNELYTNEWQDVENVTRDNLLDPVVFDDGYNNTLSRGGHDSLNASFSQLDLGGSEVIDGWADS